MRIAVTSKSLSQSPVHRAELVRRYPGVEIRFNDTGAVLRGPELIAFLKDTTHAITGLETVDGALLNALPNLKVIAKYGVGLDMIDLHALDKRGVRLGWTGGVNRRSVAELTLSFMLNLVRLIPQAHTALARGEWIQPRGNELSGKKIGIIGCGNIGREMVSLLKPFGCEIRANDLRNKEASYSEFYRTHGVVAASIEEVLEKSDVITIHVPLNAKNKNLISKEHLSRMKKGAILINTARGGLIDEEALALALKSGALSAAGLDVFAVEPPKNSELLKLPNFYCTPHIGGSTHESVLAMGNAALDALENHRPALDFLPFI